MEQQNIYEIKFLNFLKRHNLYDEEKYSYLKQNSSKVDIKINQDFIGCYFNKDEQNRIIKIRLIIPILENDITVMLAIHEYVHGYIMLDKINTTDIEEDEEEVLPMFYEYLYYLENRNKEIEEYRINMIKTVFTENKFKYKLALLLLEELEILYDYNLYDINNEVKRRYKKYLEN